jgi:hypothetical protein
LKKHGLSSEEKMAVQDACEINVRLELALFPSAQSRRNGYSALFMDGSITQAAYARRWQGNAKLEPLPYIEQDGLLWIWPGNEPPSKTLPNLNPPSNYTIHAQIAMELPVEY